MTGPRIEPLGEDALLLRLGERIDPALNARVHALAAAIHARRPPWLADIVPAHAALALFIDVDMLDAAEPHARQPPLARAEEWLRAQDFQADPAEALAGNAATAVIPVRYGGEAGPDLDALAAAAGMDAQAAISLHAGATYRVAMLGFAPGFPYLGGLDDRLATPRQATPRVRVDAGSVGIGGAQTGIYPQPGPGGWNIIGRTPLRLFDPERETPCLLVPGQRVRFRAIDDAEFDRLAAP